MNSEKLNKILINLSVILSLFYLGLFYWASLSRINYPYELEWMEGGMLQHVERINEGEDLYPEPMAEFTPFIYPPLYYYASMVASQIFGENLFSLRLVSLVSVSISFILIFSITYKETENIKLGAISVGLFAGVYGLTGSFFDLARVDSLFFMLILLTLYLLLSKNNLYWLAAAFTSFLAFYTKQSAIGIFLPLLVFLMAYDRKKLLIFGVPFALFVILLVITMNYSTDGMFSLYIFDIPATYEIQALKGVKFLFFDVFKPFALGFFAVIFLLTELYRGEKRKFALFTGLFIGMAAYSFLSRMHWGGYDNVLIPVYGVFAISLPIAFKHFNNRFNNALIPTLLIVAQLLFLIYNPKEFIPKPSDLKQGDEIVSIINEIKGDIYIPSHPYLLKMAGKVGHAHSMAVLDAMRLKNPTSKKLSNEIDSLIQSKHFSAIVTDNHWVIPDLEKYYYFEEDITMGNHFMTVCGLKSRPEKIWLPRP